MRPESRHLGFLVAAVFMVIFAGEGSAAENRAGEDEKWANWMPQVLKSPVAIELKRNSLQLQLPAPVIGLRSSANKVEIGEKIAHSLSGRIKGVLRKGETRAVLIDGLCVSPGRELTMAPGMTRDAVPCRIRLKSVEDDRVVFVVMQGLAEEATCTEVNVMLEPLLRAR